MLQVPPGFETLGHDTPEQDLIELDRLAAEAVKNSTQPAVEVGSWTGRTALVLADRFYKEGVLCVDTWRGTNWDRTGNLAAAARMRTCDDDIVLRTFCKNMGPRLFRSVIPVRGKSSFVASIWPKKVAMVFIDADHDYAAVRADILAWREHIVPGGILCGHDYGVFEGVTKAVDELIPRDQLHVGGFCLWSCRI